MKFTSLARIAGANSAYISAFILFTKAFLLFHSVYKINSGLCGQHEEIL